MCLLRTIRRILFCGQDDDEEHFHDNRNYRYYTSTSPPLLPSRSSPPDRSKTKVGDSPGHHRFRDDARNYLSPARPLMYSSENLKLPAVISHRDENRTVFSATGTLKKPVAATPILYSSTSSLSSSASAPSTSVPSSQPSYTQISSSTRNIPVARDSIYPEKLQITKDSATCSPDKPLAVSLLPKFQPPSISSSAAPAPSSKNPFLAAIVSTNKNAAAGNPFGAEKLQISADPATRSPETSHAGTLSKFPSSSVCPSTRDCNYPSPKSIAPSSKKLSAATFSSTTISIPGVPSRAWQPKLPTPLDSTTLIAENTFSPSLSLPNKDSVSHAPSPLKPSPTPISVVNSPFCGEEDRIWRKKQLSLTNSIQETLPNSFSQTSIKVPTPVFFSSEASSSSSEASSPLEPQINSRRVLSKYQIPKYLEDMIKKDIVPPVLNSPLSPSTYGDYFATLLFAEDFYLEKWSKYLLEDVLLELRPRISSSHSPAFNTKRKNAMDIPEDFVAFKIDAVPEKRPYLLSRDFVFLQPQDPTAKPFKGILFRVVKGVILVEFGDDFHSQHSPSNKYNVSFSFNRVCLKRAHQAISIATDSSFRSILFPDQTSSPQPNSFHLREKVPAVQDPVTRIANHKGPVPHLLHGLLSATKDMHQHDSQERRRSSISSIILHAVLNIYRANPRCRVLICSPTNNTSDELLRRLRNLIPSASFFRANAAFRELGLVPDDIVLSSLYQAEEECFACPPLAELLNFNIITCTYISSFRLYSAGIDPDHFSHIFLVDACMVIEPEALVPLANLAGKCTAVVVTGCPANSPGWVRSEIARRRGLKVSYFSRLLECEPYSSGNAALITYIHG